MKIIAHRGIWDKEEEQNTKIAFERALELGFGVEMDVRDCCGHLIVSHNPTIKSDNLQLEDIVKLYAKYDALVAINIKSDGLLPRLATAFENVTKERYFAFDMSIPETKKYLSAGFPTFMRISEFEQYSLLHKNSSGIWLDAFESDWWINESQVFQDFKSLCVVSPELHGRNQESVWSFLKTVDTECDLSICTDYAVKAAEYFG